MDGDKLLRKYERKARGPGTFSFTESKLFSDWGGKPDKVEMKIISLKLNNIFPWIVSVVLLAFSIGGMIFLTVKYKKEKKSKCSE